MSVGLGGIVLVIEVWRKRATFVNSHDLALWGRAGTWDFIGFMPEKKMSVKLSMKGAAPPHCNHRRRWVSYQTFSQLLFYCWSSIGANTHYLSDTHLSLSMTFLFSPPVLGDGLFTCFCMCAQSDSRLIHGCTGEYVCVHRIPCRSVSADYTHTLSLKHLQTRTYINIACH